MFEAAAGAVLVIGDWCGAGAADAAGAVFSYTLKNLHTYKLIATNPEP